VAVTAAPLTAERAHTLFETRSGLTSQLSVSAAAGGYEVQKPVLGVEGVARNSPRPAVGLKRGDLVLR